MSSTDRVRTGSLKPWRPPLGPEGFRWEIPEHFNIGAACTDVHPKDAPAIVVDRGDDPPEITTFGELGARARRLITFLRGRGVGEGDRVAVMCAQSAETAIAHVAAYLMGAIAVPLSVKFGPEAALFRMGDSGAKAAVFDADCYERLAGELAELPDLATVLVTGEAVPETGAAALTVLPLTVTESADLAVVLPDTGPGDPALLIYTSGTTGQPKGALHGHRVVLGHMPGVVRALDGFPQLATPSTPGQSNTPGDVFWTPADWAWAGGLLDVLLPSLYSGVPVVASARRPSPETVEHLLRRHGVTCSFLPPTILKMMRASGVDYSRTGLRAAFSGGEALGEAVAEWAEEALGVRVNEIYGQTECNLTVGTCHAEFPTPPGSMGRPTPGFDLVLLDNLGGDGGRDGGGDGQAVAPGEVGEICVRLPSPNAFLRYWNAPEKTAEKTAGGVLHTGDLARVDDDGNFWFSGRNDDLISTAGYRVGPGEIEDQILRHPAVEEVAVIGVPDELRGEAIVAYVVPAEGITGSGGLASEIQALVKERLAFYQYPREVVFLRELPTTNTGKIRRAQLRADHRQPPAPLLKKDVQ